ncbi:MAG: sigma-70 family RNA polymerase sigma factor [Gemmataceae bacterium]
MFETPRSLLHRIAVTPAEADWRRLVDLYQPFIARWLGQAGVPECDADDLGQDVLMVVVRDVPSFRHSENPGAFRKWLRMVVVNRMRGYWRAKQNRPIPLGATAVLDALEDPASGLSGEWDREHDTHVGRRLLSLLETEFSPITWQAFRRQVVDGVKATDVATELNMTLNAVHIAKSRVLRRFREEASGILNEL